MLTKLTKPPYRSPTSNKRYTTALFWERVIATPIDSRTIEPVFTLYEDKPGLINARKTFVELGDPTGYQWAVLYLGDWSHWEELWKASWFREAVEVWRNELRMKQQAEAIKTISKIAANPEDKQSLSAAKYLAEQAWTKGQRGRPSKSEVQGNLKKAIEAMSVEDEDLKRIGLVKG